MPTRDELERAANELVELLDNVERQGAYHDLSMREEWTRLLYVLEPATEAMGTRVRFGSGGGAPPRMWFPALQEHARDIRGW